MPGDDQPTQSFRRELLFSLPSSDNFQRDGAALVIKDVTLLAAGTWTDEAQRSACEYSGDVVTRYATNWADSTLWARHAGGVPRAVTDGIGTIENQRPGPDSTVGDLRIHGLTQQSRDTIALIEAGVVDYFSAELVGPEKWNVGRKVYTKEAITYLGGAVVNKGACKTCTLRRNNGDGEEPGAMPAACETDEPRAEPPTSDPAETLMDTTELEAKVTQLEAANAEMVRSLAAAQEENAALKTTVDTTAAEVRELAEIKTRLLKLEQTPIPKAGAPAEPARELSVPSGLVIRNGEIYQET